jgi:hypothetical protein
MLVYLCNLLDDAQDGLEVLCVLEHRDEDVLQVLLQEVLGLLGCLVLPLDDFVPDGAAELHHLDDEVENRLCLAGHHERHGLQFVLRLLLCNFKGHFAELLPILYNFGHFRESVIKVDPDQSLEIRSGRIGWEIVAKDGIEIFEILQLNDLLVESADEDEYRLLDDWKGNKMPGDDLEISVLELHADQLGDHLLLDAVVHIPLPIGVLKIEQAAIAIHDLLDIAEQVNANKDFPIEFSFDILLEVLLHLDQQHEIILGEGVVLEDIGSCDMGQLILLEGVGGHLQLEDPFLHELEYVLAFVVLVEGLDD